MKRPRGWIERMGRALVNVLVAAGTLTLLAGASAKAWLLVENPPPGRMVDAGGFRMHLYCTGAGSPTVILAAGLGSFYVTWARVQPEVARWTRVCSYDRAGMGWSESSGRPPTDEAIVEELHALLTNAGEQGPYILVGHSLGGIQMRAFAHAYPQNVVGMLLVDSAHEQQNARLAFLSQGQAGSGAAARLMSVIGSSGLLALWSDAIPNPGLPEDAYRQYRAVLATTDYFEASNLEAAVFYASPPSVPRSLGELPLIVLSRARFNLPPELADSREAQFDRVWAQMQSELAGLSTHSRHIVADKSGHNIQQDQPELVSGAILELLRGGP